MPDDAREMIAFRWHTASAGKSKDPFTEEALEAIYKLSKGLPREINKLCHISLLNAMGVSSKEVTAEMVKEASKDLRLTEEVA
jgi:general secretion pathway protein A